MTSNYLQSIQEGLSPTDRLYQIVKDGMCIGCGICQSEAGIENIKMEIVENDTERPIVHGELDHDTMDRIMQLCPGTRVEGLPERLWDKDTKHDPVWGVWQDMALVYATDPEVRHIGSTGGAMTALGIYLLEAGEVDFILHATAAEHHPSFGKPFISRTKEDVLQAAGSRYGPTATLRDVHSVLEIASKNNETFAFMGTPCDVSAIRNLASINLNVDEYCRYMFAMVCGGFMEPAGMRNFLNTIDIDYDDVKTLRYRGYGCPGATRVETFDGKVVEKNYLEFWGEDEKAWRLPFRCKVCPDGIGDSTDIAFSDTWDGGSPTWEGQIGDPGTNAAIARTAEGKRLMYAAQDTGHLTVEKVIGPEDMSRYQPHQDNKKRTVWARHAGIRSQNKVVPDTNGLRLKELAKENSVEFNLFQAKGSRKRIKEGKTSEDLPRVK